MSDGIWSALSGATGQLATLDAAANNIANASAPGYRAMRAQFQGVMNRAQRSGDKMNSMQYAEMAGSMVDMTPGALQVTGRPLDVAVRNDSFLVVNTDRGERYTRTGAIQIAQDGTLTTQGGEAYLGEGKQPIRIPSGAGDIAISSDGTVTVKGQTVGKLATVNFVNPGTLDRDGSMLFKESASSGSAQFVTPVLEPGALEMSNVSAVGGMLDIVSAVRGFEACEKAIEAFKDADSRAAMTIMGNK